MPYFDEPAGRVKIQTTSKNSQRYYTTKCLIRDLLSNDFFSQNSDLRCFLAPTRPGGMRRVQISCDICTRFARYLYSTKQSWIIMRNIILYVLWGVIKLVKFSAIFELFVKIGAHDLSAMRIKCSPDFGTQQRHKTIWWAIFWAGNGLG